MATQAYNDGPFRTVTGTRMTVSGYANSVETLDCGHDGKIVSGTRPRAKRRRCRKCKEIANGT